jgi:hypothetical protein
MAAPHEVDLTFYEAIALFIGVVVIVGLIMYGLWRLILWLEGEEWP